MQGDNDFTAQIEALKKILSEHPNARLTITGGEPGLYPNHVSEIVDTYRQYSNNVFCSINTTGYSKKLTDWHISTYLTTIMCIKALAFSRTVQFRQ